MKLIRTTFACICFSLLVVAVSSCGNSGPKTEKELRNQGPIENREAFVKQYFPEAPNLVPADFADPNWESIEGIYGYTYLKYPLKSGEMKTMMVLGSYKENKLVAAIDCNPYLIVGRQGTGKYNNKFVMPFEHYIENSAQPFNDMTAFNSLVKQVPELKNFSWKNDLQNRIYSSLIMYSQLRGISNLEASIHPESPLERHNDLVQKIYAGKRFLYNSRNFLRYNNSVDLTKEIARTGFQLDPVESASVKKITRYPNDIFNKDELSFNDRSHLFIYYPFVSYSLLPESEGRLDYWPAAAILDFKMTMSPDSFPQMTRKTYYVSLFDKKLRRTE